MKRRRWVVSFDRDQKPFSKGVAVVDVRREGSPESDSVAVWYTVDQDVGNCTECSGPLVAMSGSCAHVVAALRAIRAGKVAGLGAAR